MAPSGRPVSTGRQRREAGLCLLAALSVLCLATAVNFVYDETLWTKRFWQDEWKLENPMQFLNPSNEAPKTKMVGVSDTFANSLDGPNARREVTSDWESHGMGAVESVEDPSLVIPAAEAVQCMACHVLMAKAWQNAVMALLRGYEADADNIQTHMETACDKEVVTATLNKYAILKMESEGGAQSLMFFVVRERKVGSVPSSVERQAVRQACRTLLKDSGSELANVIVEHLATYRQQLQTVLQKHQLLGGEDGGVADGSDGDLPVNAGGKQELPGDSSSTEGKGGLPGSGSSAEATGVGKEMTEQQLQNLMKQLFRGLEVGLIGDGNQVAVQLIAPVDGDEDDLEEDPCMDVHPKCQQWADEGECEANPKYMVGDHSQVGSCRKSCGVCAQRSWEELEALKPVLLTNPALAAELEAISTSLLQSVKNHGCGSSKACLTGVSGTAFGSGFVKQLTAPSGFVLGKPFYGFPVVEVAPVSAAGSGGSGEGSDSSSEPESSADSTKMDPTTQLAADVERVLSPELKGKLLQIPADFFIYEYSYRNHSRHFHKDATTGKITEDWSLGKFQRESTVVVSGATGEAAVLQQLDLIPDLIQSMRQRSWPYVKQVYSGGEECVLAEGRRVIRRTEVRIACSPDKRLRLLIREPDFCRYIYVIYSPALCQLQPYAPKDVPTVADVVPTVAKIIE